MGGTPVYFVSSDSHTSISCPNLWRHEMILQPLGPRCNPPGPSSSRCSTDIRLDASTHAYVRFIFHPFIFSHAHRNPYSEEDAHISTIQRLLKSDYLNEPHSSLPPSAAADRRGQKRDSKLFRLSYRLFGCHLANILRFHASSEDALRP